jgi:flagellar hook protein FlgE
MSVTSALFTGVSGLLANAEGINVIGDNLANVNSIGFKSSRMLFSDILSTNINGSAQIGRGTQIQQVDTIYGQGSFALTESVTDLALQGNSFFAVKDPNAIAPVNQNGCMLTRAGSFRLDSSLNLVNPDTYQVLDTQGNPIKFSDNAAGLAAANSAVAAAYTPPATAFNTQAGTVNTAADALVTAATPPLGTAAEKAAADAIKTAAVAAQTAATAAVATPNEATNAAVQAAFAALTQLTTGSSGTFSSTAAITTAYTTFNTALTTANTANATAMTTAATPIATANAQLATAEGLAFSKITSIDPSGLITYIGKDGITLNYYSVSGQPGVPANAVNASTVQRMAIMNVINPNGLEKAGGTLFRPTVASGITAAPFTLTNNAANGISERIYTNSLEQSNVDMASQMVSMILTQRAYSANSKTITTADEMTQEALNLKR